MLHSKTPYAMGEDLWARDDRRDIPIAYDSLRKLVHVTLEQVSPNWYRLTKWLGEDEPD